MFSRLKLTNYRKHRDAEFLLQNGLVVLRGANEAGKSTLLSAILYLWFGSRALDEPLSDVVTYGENEKTLRVEGSFEIDGVKYEAYRSASGAELCYGDQRVTGQTGVTQYMERLLGGKVDVVRNLMIAEQNSVRGILDSGAEAGTLIETLADLSVIDDLIEKIKHQLPCGQTKAIETQLASLEVLAQTGPVEPVKPDVSALEAEVENAQAVYDKVLASQATARSAAEDANKKLQELGVQQQSYANAVNLQAHLSKVEAPSPCVYSHKDLEVAQQMERDAALRQKLSSLRAWKPETCKGATWTGTEDTAEAFIAAESQKFAEANAKINDLRVKSATLLATKINEGVCSFCKMDISQRPEVLDTNTKVDSQVAAMADEIATLAALAKAATESVNLVKSILTVHRRNSKNCDTTVWKMVEGVLPATYEWVGPEISEDVAEFVPSKQIESALSAYRAAKEDYDAAQIKLASLVIPEPPSSAEVQVANDTIAAFNNGSAEVAEANSKLLAAKHNLSKVLAVYDSEMQSYKVALQKFNDLQGEVKKSVKLLADMEFNNKLVKDLQSARIAIRSKLWETVTAAISFYFSRIRKEPTVITQSGNMFLQNGKPVKGLSGSAKDMLGLAIRAALLKTFIPGAPILVVDEPYAGCDADREIAGLAVLSELGFPQTLLVTHSDLADSVANQLVQL